MNKRCGAHLGFTIVELLIVVVVIAILAAITLVAFNGVTRQTKISGLKADLNSAAKQLGVKHIDTSSYPTGALPSDIKASQNTSFEYMSDGRSYCLTVRSSDANIPVFHTANNAGIRDGACTTATDGTVMQTITGLTCSSTRIRAVDARDNRTYWVQKMADGKCWMLTNLAYAGGGTNTYSDVVTLQNPTPSAFAVFSPANYYVPTNANPTVSPANPSTSTDGGQTAPQYGYLYNWCAAMGNQLTTSACDSTLAPLPDAAVSICPAGWRLPTGGTGSEYDALATSLNATAGADSSLYSAWLVQLNGYLSASVVNNQGSGYYYWTSTQMNATRSAIFNLGSPIVGPAVTQAKRAGFAIRCISA